MLGVLVFTGEVGRALELPRTGRPAAAEWRTPSARVGTRLGGDLVPKPGLHAGSRKAGKPAGVPGLVI